MHAISITLMLDFMKPYQGFINLKLILSVHYVLKLHKAYTKRLCIYMLGALKYARFTIFVLHLHFTKLRRQNVIMRWCAFM